jgi:hypothetical protein
VFLPRQLPSRWLSPNRGERKEGRASYAIATAKQEMRGEVCIGLVADESVRLIEKPFPRAHVTLTLRWHKRASDGLYRPMDAGNAIYALKAAIDGIVDAGLLVDDDYAHLVRLTGAVERCEAGAEGLLVEVEELPVAND